ncbi:hypothetical protein V2J09_007846 [Rumex salicifolius]
MIHTRLSSTIKSFQTRKVSSLLQSKGIGHRVSCLYTPAQNGSSERLNRVIIEKGFHTTIYLINRTITPNLVSRSPFECLYGKAPDYGFLKSFGCLYFPYIRPYNHNKLEFSSFR